MADETHICFVSNKILSSSHTRQNVGPQTPWWVSLFILHLINLILENHILTT